MLVKRDGDLVIYVIFKTHNIKYKKTSLHSKDKMSVEFNSGTSPRPRCCAINVAFCATLQREESPDLS